MKKNNFYIQFLLINIYIYMILMNYMNLKKLNLNKNKFTFVSYVNMIKYYGVCILIMKLWKDV